MYKKHLKLTIVILLFPFFCYTQNVEWIISDGTDVMERATSIAADNTGNLYVTGGYMGETQIGTYSLPDYGDENIFISKYDTEGNVIWVVSAGGSNQDLPMSIITDSECNVYVTGFYDQNISFGDTSFVVPGNHQIFLVKYDSSGVFQWAIHGGSYNQNWGKSVIVDSEDNIYIAGNIGANATFGDTTVLASYSFFIAKYSNDGDLLKIISSESHADINAICCDQNNNIYATGGFDGELSLNGNTVSNNSTNDDFFLASFNSLLENQWIYDAGAGSIEQGTSICIDQNNDICFTFYFSDSTSINGDSYYPNGNSDMILGKINLDGGLVWAEQVGGGNMWRDKTLITDQQNNIYFAGSFGGTDYFGGYAFTSMGYSDLFIVKYDQYGDYQWFMQGGSQFQDVGSGICIDDSYNMYFTGHFNSPIEIGGIELIGAGGIDYFLCKIGNIVGISKDQNMPVVSVYPNPSSGIVFINVENQSQRINNIKVYNSIMLVKKAYVKDENNLRFDLSYLPNGLYFISIEMSNGTKITRKIILTKN